MTRKISRVLVSVFYKEKLEPIIEELARHGATFISTGGTQTFIEELVHTVTHVETVTRYPSPVRNRGKTLHPAICCEIMFRRGDTVHQEEASRFNLDPIDLVIVDLHP